MGSTLVLVVGASSSSITYFMEENAHRISNLYILGGTTAVSKATENVAVNAAR